MPKARLLPAIFYPPVKITEPYMPIASTDKQKLDVCVKPATLWS
jgi:hypothetical protein